LGLPQLQPDKVVQHTAQVQSGYSIRIELLTSLRTGSEMATPRLQL
jgi:hypothetical protein